MFKRLFLSLIFIYLSICNINIYAANTQNNETDIEEYTADIIMEYLDDNYCEADNEMHFQL